MTDIQQTTDAIDWEVDKKKLPEMLRVLTVLTFIACGLFSIYPIIQLIKGPQTEADLQTMQDNMDKVPAFLKNFMGTHAVDIARKTMENRIPILVLGLVALALCIYGAIQMRDRKKSGVLPVFDRGIGFTICQHGGIYRSEYYMAVYLSGIEYSHSGGIHHPVCEPVEASLLIIVPLKSGLFRDLIF